MLRKCWKVDLTLEIVSEYGQEIPQSQTADKPMTPQRRATQQPRDTRKTNLAKQPALSLPIKMIAILEWTYSNVQHNNDQLQTPTMGVPINQKSQQQNHRLRTDSSLSHWGLICILLILNLHPRFFCC